MKLRSKINLYSSVLFAVLLILMNLSIYFAFSKMMMDSELRRVEAEGSHISSGILNAVAVVPAADALRSYVPVDGMIRISGGGPVDYPGITSPGQEHLMALPTDYTAERRVETIRHEGQTYASVSIPAIWTTGEVVQIQLVHSLAGMLTTLQTLRIVLLAITSLALIPVLLSSRILGRLIMQPIGAMTSTMREIRQSGHYRRLKLQEQSRDELYEMGVTFNEMMELLEANYDKQQKFVSNASHELKTPLTIIESYASLLKRRGMENPELFGESVEAIHSEAVRMKQMTEQLLLLAQRKEQWDVTLTDVDLVQLALDAAKAYRKAYDRQVDVEAEQVEMGYTDEAKLKQLLYIFLDNARKFSDEPIRIIIGAAGGERFVRVIDRGIGIPKDQLPRVFDRFYRVDEARNRQDGGAGLGLSLAVELAEAIDVRVELESIEGAGTTATIWCKPQAAPEAALLTTKTERGADSR
ncbi:sensor histidine kinase [Paenibacillus daejeonensis]|uniref:sensor histidine kinase n=1 Tax=Paenibacillus daejeonensis TaxID=135193 RepID=UPI00037CBACD|nr:HAMP domain-containing sensor histidine kinase [Paenibacillus daejeonensis]